jgi:hypothetical protein
MTLLQREKARDIEGNMVKLSLFEGHTITCHKNQTQNQNHPTQIALLIQSDSKHQIATCGSIPFGCHTWKTPKKNSTSMAKL